MINGVENKWIAQFCFSYKYFAYNEHIRGIHLTISLFDERQRKAEVCFYSSRFYSSKSPCCGSAATVRCYFSNYCSPQFGTLLCYCRTLGTEAILAPNSCVNMSGFFFFCCCVLQKNYITENASNRHNSWNSSFPITLWPEGTFNLSTCRLL